MQSVVLELHSRLGRTSIEAGTIAALFALVSMAGGCRPAERAASDSPRVATSAAFVVSDSGGGPLRIGMTVAEASRALGAPVPDTTAQDRACAYYALTGLPAGVELMWVEGRLARLEVDSGATATLAGARVGDSETRIDSLYASRVMVQPHKYVPNAKYLVIGALGAADPPRHIVFETDSARRVTRYRAGREPEVQWVEGCA